MSRNNPIKRRGMTGLKIAIIIVAFIIIAAAFSFVVLNTSFFTAQKSQTGISEGTMEATSSLQADGDLIGEFDIASGNMTKTSFYVRLSQGEEPIDTAGDKLIITYSNPYVFGVIKDGTKTGGALSEDVGDGDTLIEVGERWQVVITYATVANAAHLNTSDAYSGAYDTFRIELRPAQGAVLTLERTIPALNTKTMILE